jgi:UDP-N-acetylmuramoyl-L-alanyl-D-glutamate--2,6-diaminopimelate ligase
MNFIKKLLPNQLLKLIRPLYHGALAYFSHWYFGRPSDKLIVIGVTGTNGKSTTVNLIAKIFQEAGLRTGFTSTVNFGLPSGEKMNDLKMTMPSGYILHKWMADMVNAGYKVVVLEVSSEGLQQNRHLGINFDIAVFTNLTPEHIEAHGGFENYKLAKSKLFASLNRESGIKNQGVKKTIVINLDDPSGEYYASFQAEKKITFGVNNQKANLNAIRVEYGPRGIKFIISAKGGSPEGGHNFPFSLHLKGKFDVYNALAAIAASQALNIPLEISKKALEKIAVVPGRMEVLQERPFIVLVDYAPEPYSLQACYETVGEWPKNRLIHILGSCGGGRDKARRKVLGEMAGHTAQIVVVTNEDPYDDDPMEIINEVASGAGIAGKILYQDLYKIENRREAIKKALSLAKEGDLVLITGKGAEQKMAVAGGKYIDWDDRQVVREELRNIHNS